MKEMVILVNEQDQPLGLEEKMEAHRKGILHRAFSIFIWNSRGEMLLQRRALSKYHSPGLWTNACCSHPREGETVEQAAHRRLREEFGFDCAMKEEFSFIYHAHLDQGMQEHEFDHVLYAVYDGPILQPNPEEVGEFRWVEEGALEEELKRQEETFTVWFKIAWQEILARRQKD